MKDIKTGEKCNNIFDEHSWNLLHPVPLIFFASLQLLSRLPFILFVCQKKKRRKKTNENKKKLSGISDDQFLIHNALVIIIVDSIFRAQKLYLVLHIQKFVRHDCDCWFLSVLKALSYSLFLSQTSLRTSICFLSFFTVYDCCPHRQPIATCPAHFGGFSQLSAGISFSIFEFLDKKLHCYWCEMHYSASLFSYYLSV